jgi:trans-aconitate 2-methyltransferase
MAAPEAIIEWIRGTGLRPFLEALSTDDQRARFTTKLLERAAVEYPSRSDGKVIFPFRRLFFVAYCA